MVIFFFLDKRKNKNRSSTMFNDIRQFSEMSSTKLTLMEDVRSHSMLWVMLCRLSSSVFCLTKPMLDPLAFSWPRIVYHFQVFCVPCALDSPDRGGRSSTLFSTSLIGVGIAGPEGQVHRRLHGLHTLSRVPG